MPQQLNVYDKLKLSPPTTGYLFELEATDTAGGIFETEAVANIAKTHVLKVRINSTDYYIPLNTAKTA